jgi:hypothetical protein
VVICGAIDLCCDTDLIRATECLLLATGSESVRRRHKNSSVTETRGETSHMRTEVVIPC